MAAPLVDTTKSASGGIPIADLKTISLAKLHAKENIEIDRLDKAASNTGFFYLDLRGDSVGERVLANLPDMYAVAAKYFAQPEEAKAKDARHDIKPSQDIGYKKRRTGQDFDILRDEIRSNRVSHLPEVFQMQRKQIAGFSASCDDACLTLLNSLSTDFAVHHRVDQPSETGLKMTLEPSLARRSDGGDNLHTDSGTLTMLFYEELGLHAFYPDANLWAFAPIVEGCGLINVANSLQRLSGGRFHSPKHRMTQASDGAKDRYFLSYFLRPENAFKEAWEVEA